MLSEITILPGLRKGTVSVPQSKSHLHRLMIADFLASWQNPCRKPAPGFPVKENMAEDILATKSCLEALRKDGIPSLPCRESGSTLRFLMPVAMACRQEAYFSAEGRLPQRPILPFLELLSAHGVTCLSSSKEHPFPLHLSGMLQPGDYILPGNISSQIVTGLLMALPILSSNSTIRLTSPMESRGYVDMTLELLKAYQIEISEKEGIFKINGKQNYRAPASISPELDWSGAAFWIAMNHIGSNLSLPPMPENSRQPDRQIQSLLGKLGQSIDVSQCPDIFPVLSVLAAATPANTIFTGVRRLRLKESDRLAAMEDVLQRFGVKVNNEENSFTVFGIGPHFQGGATIDPRNDHRIAMSAAVAATVANGPVTIKNPECIRKSFPSFFQQFQKLPHKN